MEPAERPEKQVKRNPVPSLLTSLLTDHLDPGYGAAAAERTAQHTRKPRVPAALWLLAGAVVIGVIFGIAFSQLASGGADVDRAGSDASAAVRAAQDRSAELEATRQALVEQVSSERDRALQSDVTGSALLDRLSAVESAAGIDSVTGPGLSVVVTEPVAEDAASDRSIRGGSGAAVLDRDIAAIVNSLWASGAEAVSVDGIRVGPNVTIRQAGGAMLLDNRPIDSPYAIEAIGPPQRIQVQFVVSDAYLRMSTVAQLYDVGFTVRPATDLELGPAAVRESFVAEEVGRR
ncbi:MULTISPECIES: DUF881 domain-containing protein [unclassified Rhodococcus (in: high G+C Gram-positive bacteria)]|uniref:DUF881 domain-containing protein n=1 Tax=unclassified Rhodococcus (in: high G+C Gram-positive bacteria) TaxID=192944 RepID=UPI0007BBE0B2|nr:MULTISPECIES: DUF881 domain-containing protein [unclassified Rhodococcus (in: high G+C Gram-positive bacteria)]KZF08982.1 hypothetical protein A2J02_19390 [Rhodococcus sp. EPR-147]KZF10178.1 hypothetical protein A2J04_21010 [Rhodococcus sp. EPR-279]